MARVPIKDYLWYWTVCGPGLPVLDFQDCLLPKEKPPHPRIVACSSVCLEESDMDKGLVRVKGIEDATSILLAQTADKLRELMRMAFYKPPRMCLPASYLILLM
ncbi:hypothetical protein Ccrd_023000 [Cynara cardunculus var. scolymus]|uniref:Uncharacterized protein n=1 Tax=Cynara cardunculus var. scolymus TaxID=59895 RepID=A0A103XXQ2_CYNCS|nr:hypothetical protein Ccrd_023000 [Cynara cardunculus var. scolymus]